MLCICIYLTRKSHIMIWSDLIWSVQFVEYACTTGVIWGGGGGVNASLTQTRRRQDSLLVHFIKLLQITNTSAVSSTDWVVDTISTIGNINTIDTIDSQLCTLRDASGSFVLYVVNLCSGVCEFRLRCSSWYLD